MKNKSTHQTFSSLTLLHPGYVLKKDGRLKFRIVKTSSDRKCKYCKVKLPRREIAISIYLQADCMNHMCFNCYVENEQ